jgi:predicted TIM-barrel fold metal-dependent hydrolase
LRLIDIARQFQYSPNRHLTPPQATVQDYEAFKKSLGITKSVLTHGLSYGDDCSSLKHFIQALGRDRTWGCAVINEETSEDEIASLAASGVCGIRLNLYAYNAMVDFKKQVEVLQKYADRVRSKGWFLEFLQINPQNWAPLNIVISNLGLQVVTDHHALLKANSMLPDGTDVLSQPGMGDITALLKKGNFWIKLSAPYRSSTQAPHYSDMKPLVLALIEANPRRVLWGSDW